MHQSNFDLPGIVGTLQKNKRFILMVMLLAAIIATIAYFIRPTQYKAEVEFIPYNPLYSDRQNIFRLDEARYIGYFASENDMDRILAIAEASNTVGRTVDECKDLLQSEKEKNEKKRANLIKEFQKKFKIKLTDNQTMAASFVDKDSLTAIKVINKTVHVLEDEYRNYINGMSLNIVQALQHKIRETDSVIYIFSDSLATLRDHYKIYDIINPARNTIINGSYKHNGVPGFAKGLEEIQHIEAIKDQMVKDRATYTSLLNEHTTGREISKLPLLHVISSAEDNTEKDGLNLSMTILSALFASGFFTSIFVLLRSAIKK